MPQMPGCCRVGMANSSASMVPLSLRSMRSPGMCGQRPSILASMRSWPTICGWLSANTAAPPMWSQWLWL